MNRKKKKNQQNPTLLFQDLKLKIRDPKLKLRLVTGAKNAITLIKLRMCSVINAFLEGTLHSKKLIKLKWKKMSWQWLLLRGGRCQLRT
jgi:hypothetical protein